MGFPALQLTFIQSIFTFDQGIFTFNRSIFTFNQIDFCFRKVISQLSTSTLGKFSVETVLISKKKTEWKTLKTHLVMEITWSKGDKNNT